MADLGTADNVYVCGPDCKALQQVMEESKEHKTPWWELVLTIIFTVIIAVSATVGALDVGVRTALDYWSF